MKNAQILRSDENDELSSNPSQSNESHCEQDEVRNFRDEFAKRIQKVKSEKGKGLTASETHSIYGKAYYDEVATPSQRNFLDILKTYGTKGVKIEEIDELHMKTGSTLSDFEQLVMCRRVINTVGNRLIHPDFECNIDN